MNATTRTARDKRIAVIDEFYEAVRDAQARAMQSVGGGNAIGSRSRSYGAPASEDCSLRLHQRYRQAGAKVAAGAVRDALDAAHTDAVMAVRADLTYGGSTLPDDCTLIPDPDPEIHRCQSCRSAGVESVATWRTEASSWLTNAGVADSGEAVKLCGECFEMVSGCPCGLLHWDDHEEDFLPGAQARHDALIEERETVEELNAL